MSLKSRGSVHCMHALGQVFASVLKRAIIVVHGSDFDRILDLSDVDKIKFCSAFLDLCVLHHDIERSLDKKGVPSSGHVHSHAACSLWRGACSRCRVMTSNLNESNTQSHVECGVRRGASSRQMSHAKQWSNARSMA